jgi:hypothetical protein
MTMTDKVDQRKIRDHVKTQSNKGRVSKMIGAVMEIRVKETKEIWKDDYPMWNPMKESYGMFHDYDNKSDDDGVDYDTNNDEDEDNDEDVFHDKSTDDKNGTVRKNDNPYAASYTHWGNKGSEKYKVQTHKENHYKYSTESTRGVPQADEGTTRPHLYDNNSTGASFLTKPKTARNVGHDNMNQREDIYDWNGAHKEDGPIKTNTIATLKHHKISPYESSSCHWGHKGRRNQELNNIIFNGTNNNDDAHKYVSPEEATGVKNLMAITN